MKRARILGVATVLVCWSLAASAHVTVWPQQSKAGATERYTVRVPTEGSVATVSLELEIPDDVTVTGILAPAGYAYDVVRNGTRITRITWRQEIKPGEIGEFVFFARNPSKGAAIAWRAHQHFTDGTVNDWVGPSGDRRPAATVRLTP
jgi:uncharacterized protein YcnI